MLMPLQRKCSICQQEFKEKSLRDDHLKTVHGIEESEVGKRYHCTWPDCGLGFNLKETLTEHTEEHTQNGINCDICSINFKTPTGYKKHMKIHKNKQEGVQYECKICSKAFYHKYNLSCHEAAHNTACVCDYCGKSFGSSRLLDHHKNKIHLHVQLKTHTCPKCSEEFDMKSDLKRHIAVAHEEQSEHICYLCGALVKNLTHHVRNVHSNTGRVHCLLCKQDFTLQKYLDDHINEVHGNESGKKFTCTWPECDKSFLRKRDLKLHLDTHNDVRPHSCHICAKKFRQKLHLKVHVDWHNGVRAHQCQLCESTFLTKGNLTNHMATHAKEPM